jgi:CDP-diacylglycerol--inositol 3-phosphatidyltransferase
MLSMLCLSSLYSVFSGHHIRGSCIALHAHVQVSYFWHHKILIPSSLNQGVSSHKKIPKEQSWILRQYYGNNVVLFLFCACNELFFVSIYLLSFPPPPNSPPRLGMNKLSRISPANLFLGYIRGMPLSYPYLLAFITFPICAFKNWINVIQMINAAKALAEVDKEDREHNSQLRSNSRPKRSTAGKRSRIDD